MTTSLRSERSTSQDITSKVIAFLNSGGKAKAGKVITGAAIELVGSVDDSKLEEYRVVVPREGVCSAYWHSASFDDIAAHGAVLVKGAEVSYVK